MPRSAAMLLCLVLAWIGVLQAADSPPDVDQDSSTDAAPGHSQHGEAFDEGPCQAAYLMPGTGGPAFVVTTKNQTAQQFINQGVGQLHGFWYWEAERSFRQAAKLDPDCAMAYWGLALANVNNDTRALTFIREALKRKAGITPRELAYIEMQSAYLEAVDKAKAADKANEKKEAEKKAAEQPASTKTENAAEKGRDAAANDTPAKSNCDPAEEKKSEDQPADSAALKQREQELEQRSKTLSKRDEELKKREAEIKKKEAEISARESTATRKADETKKKAADEAKAKAKRERLEARLKAWDKLVQDYPDDTHAAAFYVYQLWHDRDTVPMVNYALVDALLDKIFAVEPLHPAHHYRIHLWDNKRPEKAVASAAMGGPSAPAIAHMWHMPGHTYSKLKRFHDAVYQQEASARVDHAYMQRDRVMPYQIHNYAHNNEWCIRNLLTIGRVSDALRLSKNLVEIPRHPKLNKADVNSSAAGWGRDRLYDTLVKQELWPQLLELADTAYLHDPQGTEPSEIRRRRYWAVAAALVGDQAIAQQQRTWIADLQRELKAAPKTEDKTKPEAKACGDKAQTTAVDQAKTADKAEKSSAKPTRRPTEISDLSRRCEEALLHIDAALATRAGKHTDALKLYKKVGNLPKEQLIYAQMEAGETAEAVKTGRALIKSAAQAVTARAALVRALIADGNKEEAATEFAVLRKLSATADQDLPALKRLNEYAFEAGCPDDWRLPLEPASDLGERPALDTLGPLTWTPSVAGDWKLPNQQGKIWSLQENFRGRPVVVIFYLGYGCIHCVEQLNTFGPLAKQYEQAGIQLIAVSTDTVEQLQKSLEQAKSDGGFPFPLVADPSKRTFREYRCFDDFEERAMHGTFLIDARGRIRWQEIGAEPFTDAEFLLKESQRLLTLPE